MKTYKIRQHIEEVNKQLKFLGLSDCQMRNIKAQSNHIICGITALALIEKLSRGKNISVYKQAKNLILKKDHIPNTYFERLSRTA